MSDETSNKSDILKKSQALSHLRVIQNEDNIELGNVLQGRNIPSAKKTDHAENKLKIF
jgi:hypothetical protein